MRLIPRMDGQGRVPAVEVMIATPYIQECIAEKDKTRLIRDAITAGVSQYGMQTFDQSHLPALPRRLHLLRAGHEVLLQPRQLQAPHHGHPVDPRHRHRGDGEGHEQGRAGRGRAGRRRQMKAQRVRETFLQYFADRGHRIVRSSPLLPKDDPTILFTNAGMNQFKNVFLGLEKRGYSRAATVQKCMRGQRQAQRPRDRRPDGQAPHLLRDARQLLLRRLLQEGGRRLRLGPRHPASSACPRSGSTRRSTSTTTRPTGSGPTRSASRRTGSSATARRTTSGPWATPGPAARAPSSTTTSAPTSSRAIRSR
ncbi:MAG: alanine--tRNA ligase-related protein [Candidatus Moduliflexus flocculans]|nr:alanine--tRNA ligase-related protein [Candidatus Moduliflexus flocculans]